MVLFIKDENRMKGLWNKGIVTKVIRSKGWWMTMYYSTQNIYRYNHSSTAKAGHSRIPNNWRKPEGEEDNIQSNSITTPIEDIAVPEIFDKPDIVQHLQHCKNTNNPLKKLAGDPERPFKEKPWQQKLSFSPRPVFHLSWKFTAIAVVYKFWLTMQKE